MENREKVTKIIYRTLETLLNELETKEDLDILIYSLEDYEKEGYPLDKFKEKYGERIKELKDRLYE